jgi:hypothetical protein
MSERERAKHRAELATLHRAKVLLGNESDESRAAYVRPPAIASDIQPRLVTLIM